MDRSASTSAQNGAKSSSRYLKTKRKFHHPRERMLFKLPGINKKIKEGAD